MFPVFPVAEQLLEMTDHLTRWLAAGQVLKVHLYVNNFAPTANNVLADYTEEDSVSFPGYAAITIAQSGTPFINAAGQVETVWTDPVFQPSSTPPTPQTIYGYFVTLHPVAGPDLLLYGKKFDVAKIVQFATDALTCDPDLAQLAITAPETE